MGKVIEPNIFNWMEVAELTERTAKLLGFTIENLEYDKGRAYWAIIAPYGIRDRKIVAEGRINKPTLKDPLVRIYMKNEMGIDIMEQVMKRERI